MESENTLIAFRTTVEFKDMVERYGKERDLTLSQIARRALAMFIATESPGTRASAWSVAGR